MKMKYLRAFETDHFTADQAGDYRVPGYVIVQTKGECTRMADLTPAEVADLTRCLARAESLVERVVRPERIYVLKFGEQNPRIHFHVFPRTTRIAEAYAAEVGDEPPYNGARLVDWIWQDHASLGFSDAEIQLFVDEARRLDSGGE